ncbi:plasmid replication protein RepC [Pseudooceanicola aestuarii]|uniref:plasmid replication protein RepC n=1 Tax=Pseudooceanicola aestuarii TaxID=2697319 RepID=UPI0013D104D5|nr:plasmid replication protein RepC [Pseudooceanicola aestuarii]
MGYDPVTPFRRPVDAAHLTGQQLRQKAVPPQGVNKWESLRVLSRARRRLGVSDRDLTVLQALLSFHPDTILGATTESLIVYPSNRAICERLNGMPCSTMRRHLSHLVAAGLLLRRDSPNGKRYARSRGAEKVAYGFDLTPLAVRHVAFCQLAEEVRAEQEAFRDLREAVSLMRRDLAGLAEYGISQQPHQERWARFTDLAALTARGLRRKLTMADLNAIHAELSTALEEARDLLETPQLTEMSTNDAEIEQHHQSSDKDLYDLEPATEEASDPDVRSPSVVSSFPLTGHENLPKTVSDPPPVEALPNIPLSLVKAACPEILSYADAPLRHWHHLVRAADQVSPMMGISPSAWQEAKVRMGPEQASAVVAAMLQRLGEIRSPGGYLRSLSARAAAGRFSCGPMIMALVRREAA